MPLSLTLLQRTFEFHLNHLIQLLEVEFEKKGVSTSTLAVCTNVLKRPEYFGQPSEYDFISHFNVFPK